LTIAAVCRLGHELFDRSTGIWSAAILALFYWHVHLSHLALRANLYIFLSALAAVSLVNAYRTGSPAKWAWSGVALGLVAYTYFASFGWIAYVGLLLLAVAFFDRRKRSGALLAATITVLCALPLLIYVYRHPDVFLVRPTGVAVTNWQDVLGNLCGWARAWFYQGDLDQEFNLAGRPIFAPAYIGMLGFVGVAALFLSPRQIRRGLILVGWMAVGCLPSLLSNQSPHFLRASGMIIPIVVIMAVGGSWLGGWLQRVLKVPFISFLSLLVLIPMGVRTYDDFHVRWIHSPDTFILMEEHINKAVAWIRDAQPDSEYVYFSPLTPAHPVIAFRAHELAPRSVSAFDSHYCMVLPDHKATYVSLTMYEPGFQQRLAQYADVVPVYTDIRSRYSIFSATPHCNVGDYVARFGDSFDGYLMNPIAPSVSVGSSIPVTLGIRPLHTPEIYPSVFVHLYGIPTPYEGGPLWAQADSQLCTSYPAHLWRVSEMIVQKFVLDVPTDTLSGNYTVAIGIYPFPAGARLPVTFPHRNPLGYVIIGKVTITDLAN